MEWRGRFPPLHKASPTEIQTRPLFPVQKKGRWVGGKGKGLGLKVQQWTPFSCRSWFGVGGAGGGGYSRAGAVWLGPRVSEEPSRTSSPCDSEDLTSPPKPIALGNHGRGSRAHSQTQACATSS